MKKVKFLTVGLFVCAAAVVGYKVSPDTALTDNKKLLLENVEAMAEAEQPDVKDCIYDPVFECWALHPTNEKLDTVRTQAKW